MQMRSNHTHDYINSSQENVMVLCQTLLELSSKTSKQYAARLAKHAAATACVTANQTAASYTQHQARNAESYATLCDVHTSILYTLACCFTT